MEFAVGFLVALVVVGFVLRNQVRKHEELQAYVNELEVGAREYSDELWDKVAALEAKLAEVKGRVFDK